MPLGVAAVRRPTAAPLAGAVAALVCWLLALAVGAPAAGAAAEHQAEEETVGTEVHLREVVGRTVTNDRVRAFLRAEAQGLDPTEVQREVNRLMAAGLAAARAVEGVRATTEGYAVYYREDERRWVGQQRLRLEAEEPGGLLPLVGELQQLSLLMDGLESYLSHEAAEALTDELTVEALGRVQDRVRLLVETLGYGASRLKELRFDGTGEPPPIPFRAIALERAEMAAAMPPPAFEAGETRVEMRVEATAVLSP